MRQEAQQVWCDVKQNEAMMSALLPIKESFDLICRELQIGEREAAFYFVDGMIKDEAMVKILGQLLGITKEKMPEDATGFSRCCMPYVEVDIYDDFDTVVRNVLSGAIALFIDGYEACIVLDCRTYPARSVEEPAQDKSLRGSRDGFVETIVFDTALIRRRIRDPQLVMEMLEVGTSSRSDVVLCYMKNLAKPELVANLRRKIQEVVTPDLCMNQQSLAEALIGTRWYNPFPKFTFTERPDTAAACVMEGKVVILVDNAPSAMILPTSIFDMIEEANDYYFPAWTALYLKFTRVLILLLTVFMTPVFVLLMQNPQWIPPELSFISVRDVVNIPLVYQLLILELVIDGLRLAALNTPNMLSTPLSVVAGIILGDYTVSSGWFNAEIMLYMAFVAVANYTQVSLELGYALKFMRIILICLTAAFGPWGLLAGTALVVVLIVTNRTISGKSYIYPIVPFNAKQFLRRFFRVNLPSSEK